MTGRAEVERLRQRLEATFDRAKSLSTETEIASDFARHLCVLLSGFLEQAVKELLLEYVRHKSDPRVQKHVERGLQRFANPKVEKLLQVFGSFDKTWRQDLEVYLVDERRDAVNGVVDQRNKIAHGDYTGITLSGARDYYGQIKKVVDHLADICLPMAR